MESLLLEFLKVNEVHIACEKRDCNLHFALTSPEYIVNFFSLGSKSDIYFETVQKIRRLKKEQKGKF